MRYFALGIFLVIVLVACGGVSQTPTGMPPTFPPLAMAQTTFAPTPSVAATDTAVPTSTSEPSATPIVQATNTPTQTLARQAPSILTQFKLLDLPGEGRAPSALALLGDSLYVANWSTDNLAIVADDAVKQFIPIGVHPSALVADPERNRVYAGTYETPTISLLENERVVKQVAAGGRINALALDSNVLYVALDNDAIIERYDATTLAKKDELKLSQGFGVGDLVVDTPRNRLYAAIYGKIVGIDLAAFKELSTFEVPYLYSHFAVNPVDGSIWGGAYDEKISKAYVVGFSPDGREIARLNIGADLRAVAFDDAERLLVLDHFNNRVYVIQTPQAQLVVTVPINEAPSTGIYDAARKIFVVASQDNDNLSKIDLGTLKVVKTIPLASDITALVANQARGRVYAASGSTNSIFVIEGNRVVGQVQAGNYPVDLAVDSTTNRVYAANRADGTLSVIDEDTLTVTASPFITSALSTVAVDSVNRKLFAGSTVLNPDTLAPEATFFAQGFTINSQTVAQYERVNPALKKLYAVASNGVPGSNSRLTLYAFSYDNLTQSKLLGSKNGGNMTALAIDSSTNNLFATNTHPLAYTHGLDVFDAQDNLVQSLAQGSSTSALVVNPETHHLFLAHAETFAAYPREPQPRDNTVEVLDTRTLGQVATLDVPGEPWRMTLLRDTVYVASHDDGTITIIGDAATSQPPAPTPTLTPTPYPTFPSPAQTSTPVAQAQCDEQPAQIFIEKWRESFAALGCPMGNEALGQFAVQTFKDGYMFDDLRNENAKKIYVLFPDHTYAVFDDTWKEGGESDHPCNDVPIPSGRIHPKRGFGKVWCENKDVQQKLPGAVADEHLVTLDVQPFTHGMMWGNTPQGGIVLLDNGTWK
ncbi:MAG TPA: hypothetical protein VFD70_22805 [Anaerolineae bacterium]|nr:hypothetical protein [Anaerolineae bacterium]